MTIISSYFCKVAVQSVLPSIGAGCLILNLFGCTTAPFQGDFFPSVDVPIAWSPAPSVIVADGGSSNLLQWWLRFDDVLLSDLITQALAKNTTVTSAQAALRQARALRDVSAAGLSPVLGSSASVQRTRAGNNRSVNTFDLGLDASWELDIFGGNRSALDASEANVRASAASLGDVQVSIAAEVALSYIALRGAQAQFLIASDNLSSQLETLQITQWRYRAGLITSLDTEQARTAAEQTRAQLPVLQKTIEQTSHALAVLTAHSPASLNLSLASISPIPEASNDFALVFPAEMLRQRPDVHAAEDRIRAAVALVAQADAARMPDFRLSGSLGLSALKASALSNGASVVTAMLAGVSWPIFDGGAARAQVRVQQAALEQEQIAYQAIVLTALTDVEDAIAALRSDHERLLSLQNAVVAASNAASMANQQYSSGLVDFQTVLETQRTRLSTQDSVASARVDLSTDQVRLYKAFGGGWRTSDMDVISAPNESLSKIPNS